MMSLFNLQLRFRIIHKYYFIFFWYKYGMNGSDIGTYFRNGSNIDTNWNNKSTHLSLKRPWFLSSIFLFAWDQCFLRRYERHFSINSHKLFGIRIHFYNLMDRKSVITVTKVSVKTCFGREKKSYLLAYTSLRLWLS